jgi:hypothetical protein
MNLFNRRKQKKQRGYSVYSTVPLVAEDGGNRDRGVIDRESIMFSRNRSTSLSVTVADSATPEPIPELYYRQGDSYIPLEQIDRNPSVSSQASRELNEDLSSYYATVPASYFNSIARSTSGTTPHSLPGTQPTDNRSVSPVYPNSIHDWRNSQVSYDTQVPLDSSSHTNPYSYRRDGQASPPS